MSVFEKLVFRFMVIALRYMLGRTGGKRPVELEAIGLLNDIVLEHPWRMPIEEEREVA